VGKLGCILGERRMSGNGERPAGPGFWRRVGAFAIDGVVLGLIGLVLGWTAFDTLARMGEWSRLIGLTLGTSYFGILGSHIGGGRSLGQRLLGLRVVGVDGAFLDLPRAFARAFILVLPMVLNGASMRGSSPSLLLHGFVAAEVMLVFGLGLAQLYLLIFNRPSRRMVHDLLTRSAVVPVSATAHVAPASRTHIGVAAGLVVAAGALHVVLASYFTVRPLGGFSGLAAAYRSVEALPEVESATVGDTTTVAVTTGGRSAFRNLTVNARLNAWPRDRMAEARRLGRAAVAAHPLAPGQNLVVIFRYGFDLGIGSSWRSYNARLTG
jgi:uncharacterized RDD family membrane protein YckC